MATAFPSFSAVGAAGDSVIDANSVDVPVAGTPAAGNLLIIHVGNQRAENTWAVPSGWTQISSQVEGMAAFYKIAVGGETTVTVTKTGTTGRCLGRMMLFIDNSQSIPIDVSGSSTTNTTSTMTPVHTNTLWVILAGCFNNDPTFSTYAMATNDPTPWTERYDFAGTSQNAIAGATSSLRTQATATGNVTFVETIGDVASIVFAISPDPNALLSPAVITMTATVQAPSIVGHANVTVSAVVGLTASVNAPTVTTAAPDWVNQSKSSAPTWTNQSKN